MSFSAAIKRFFLEWPYTRHELSYLLGSKFAHLVLLPVYALLYLPARKKALKFLLLAHRATYSPTAGKLLQSHLTDIAGLIEPCEPDNDKLVETLLGRSIVLKIPKSDSSGQVVSKGILLIKFTETAHLFLKYVDCEALLSEFYVIIEPSFAGYAIEDLLGWCQFSNHKIYIESAEKRDYDFLNELQSNLIPVRTGSGEWVDSSSFTPKGLDKKYDSIYIANHIPFKRAHRYLRAIHRIKQRHPDYKAALVCATWGDLGDNVRQLIALYELDEQLDYFEDLPQSELAKVLDSAKVNTLLSLKEGSNRSLFEAFFVDVPGIVLSNNTGVNKELFTPETGLAVDDADFENALLHFAEHWQDFRAREWALENITPEKTMAKILDVMLQQENLPSSYKEDIFLKVNNPEANYAEKYTAISKQQSEQMVAKFLRQSYVTAQSTPIR